MRGGWEDRRKAEGEEREGGERKRKRKMPPAARRG